MNPEKREFESEFWSNSTTGSLGVLHIRYADLAGEERIQELQKVFKEMKRIEGVLAQLDSKLNNEQFTSKAPKHVVEAEGEKYNSYKIQYESLQKTYAELSVFVAGIG
jgi:valyl-tRNA synthetase